MAALIGTRKHAIEAIEVNEEYEQTSAEKTGWMLLGGGSMRNAWLHIGTNVVYKVETWRNEGMDNATEAKRAAALRVLAWTNVRIPLTSLFKVESQEVLAMERIIGTLGTHSNKGSNAEHRREMLERGRLSDMHGDNFMFEDSSGKLVPVDMGSHRRKSHAEADHRVLRAGDGSCGW